MGSEQSSYKRAVGAKRVLYLLLRKRSHLVGIWRIITGRLRAHVKASNEKEVRINGGLQRQECAMHAVRWDCMQLGAIVDGTGRGGSDVPQEKVAASPCQDQVPAVKGVGFLRIAVRERQELLIERLLPFSGKMTLMYRRGLPDNVMPDVGALTAFYYFATQVLHVLATFVYRLLLVAAGVYADRRRKAYDAHYEIYSDNRWRDVNHPCHYAQDPDAATLRRHRAATAGLDANELADEIDMFQLSDEAKSRPRTTHPFATPAGAPRLGAPVVPQQVTQHVPWHAAQTGARPLNSFGHHNAFRAAMNTDIRSVNQASIPRGFYLTEESTHGRTPITQQEMASSRFGGLLHGERRKFWQQQAPSVTSPPFAGLRSTPGSQWLSVRPSVRPLALQSRRRRTDQIATSSSDESDADYAHDDDEDDGDNKYGTYRSASARAYEPASVPAVPRRSGPGRMKTEERGSDDMEEDDDDDQFGTTSVLNNMQQQTRYPQPQQTLRGPAWKAPGSQTTWLRKPVAFDLHPVLAVPDELDTKISERLFL
ncbi:hypothetical protein RI367_006626 [Sorochytrium milnesiophthora]